MSLTDLGNLGEFIGAVAVVVSLLYLSTQVRQNTRSVKDSVYESNARASSDAVFQVGLDSEAADLLLRGSQEYESQSAKDRLRFHFLMLGVLNNYETLFYHYQRGNVDPELWASRIVRLRAFLSRPGVATWWEQSRTSFRESFQQLVDEITA